MNNGETLLGTEISKCVTAYIKSALGKSFAYKDYAGHVDEKISPIIYPDTITMFLWVKDIIKAKVLFEEIGLHVVINQCGKYGWLSATYKNILTIKTTENRVAYERLKDI